MEELINKKILIVGGTSGIGLEVAKELLKENCQLSIASRSREKFDKSLLAGRDRVSFCQLDASREKEVIDFFAGGENFDHLISTIKPPHVDSSEGDVIKNAFDIKFWGQYYLTIHGLKRLNEGGSILLSSGIASRRGYRGFSGTAAMNGAVESFVRSLAGEIAPVRINCVCPGFIERFPHDSEREKKVRAVGARLPLHRLGGQKEVAQAYLFLLKNTYTTGSVLTVDGGELSV
ncbi:MAG: SDR family oxidoreductase [Spirochaetales bacterium]|nr:SDR family oxidoreductase [Spirochaetales bacterium]